MAFPTKDDEDRIEIWRGLGWILYRHENKYLDTMATHIGCAEDHEHFEPDWTGQSFFLADMCHDDEDIRDGYCYGCGVPVPPEVQALMTLIGM